MARPVIDEDKFAGADKGIVLPARNLNQDGLGLQLKNFDRSDPPNYAPNGVPRDEAFNKNVLTLSADGKMPKIAVTCEAAGFTPSKDTPIFWRLQTLQVMARFVNVGNYHYRSRVVPLQSEWTGSSTDESFTLFGSDPAPAGIVYDNWDDRIAGGHAVLTVAAKANGSWLQDYVHLRITGSNPTEADIRNAVKTMVAGRNAPPLENMLDAIFAWEASMREFEPGIQTHSKFGETGYKVLFTWPGDPKNFPVSAFDFGVGISQFTDPSKLTTAIAWDWRANIAAGANEFFGHLKNSFKPNITWADWAYEAWRRYNGSGSAAVTYAKRLAASPDGGKVPQTRISKRPDSALAPIAIPAPPPPKWPVSKAIATRLTGAALTSAVNTSATQTIGEAASSIAGNREVLAWMWPQVVENLHSQSNRAATVVIPGLSGADLSSAVAGLTKSGIGALADAAFDHAWSKLAPASSPAAASPPSSLTSEWNSLSDFVRRNIGQGRISDWAKMRSMMLNAFGAPNDPVKAIQRINAYYSAFVDGRLQQGGASMKVRPEMAGRMQKAQALIVAKGASARLAAVSDISGFNIRPNANNANEPSLHSFGIAIDLDPSLNPNMSMPDAELKRWTDLVEFLTGIAPYGNESKRLRTQRSYDTALPDVVTLCNASSDYVAANKNLAGLAAAVCRGFQGSLSLAVSMADANRLLALAAPPHPDLAALKEKIASLLVPSAKRAAMADRIVYAMQMFTMSQKAGLKPAITGSAATTARYGFINLPAEVICGLSASDGGSLRWLGTSNSTKDYMHFDFRDAEQPPRF